MSFRIPRVVSACLPVSIGFLLAVAPLPTVAPAEASPASGQETLTLDDVLRLHAAGLSDNIIASEILVTGTVFELTADDLLRLHAAGLSEELIQFLVDTGLDETPPAEPEEAGLEDDEGAAYAGAWTNEIAEEPATTYFVTLNYGYSDWWYDLYWRDYWSYDAHYYPYAYSYCWTYGTWYPGWYTYRYCYLPPTWGYRSHWYAYWGYPWTIDSCDRYYASGVTFTADYRHRLPLSDRKYKTGDRSFGKRLYADAGLKVRDLDRLTRTHARVDRKPIRTPGKGLIVADARTPGGDRIHRPIKTTTLSGATKRPITAGKTLRLDGGTKIVGSSRARPTRRPALDKPPTPRVRTTHTVEKPRTPVKTTQPSVEKPRVNDRYKPRAVTRTTRRSDPPAVEKPRSNPPATEKPSVQSRSKPRSSPPTPPPAPKRAAPVPSPPPQKASPPPRAPKGKPAPAQPAPRTQQKSRGKPRR